MSETMLGLSAIAELGGRALGSSAEAIAAATELAQRLTGVDITVVSEITADGQYVFRGIEKRPDAPVSRDDAIPYEWSLCSRIHAGESPSSVAETRDVPALWAQWLRLKAGLGVEWDVRAFCTREVRLPDGTLYGTLCLHHLEPRTFAADEEALLEVLARLLGEEIARERAAERLGDVLGRLQRAEQRRVELVDELRHELRAPLQVLDGYAEGMLDGVVERDDEHIVLMRREATRATRLLDDLAELTALEASAVEQTEPVRLDLAAAEMRDRLAPLADSAGVALAVELEPVTVLASRKRVEQILVNLVRNALRATQGHDGACVRISVRPVAGAAVVCVDDDGPGIPPAELPRVFERFYRGSSERERSEGTGLGLTITRRIVEAYGGEIAAEALEPRGVRFRVWLPVDSEARSGGLQSAMQST